VQTTGEASQSHAFDNLIESLLLFKQENVAAVDDRVCVCRPVV
jgi:hypothetical protein